MPRIVAVSPPKVGDVETHRTLGSNLRSGSVVGQESVVVDQGRVILIRALVRVDSVVDKEPGILGHLRAVTHFEAAELLDESLADLNVGSLEAEAVVRGDAYNAGDGTGTVNG